MILIIWVVYCSIKLPAGIFVPSLAAGAAFGRIVGVSLQHLAHRFPHWSFLPPEDHISPGVYALIGAAATLAGVTRTTVSLAVIVVELTGTLDYVVPVAIAILAAKVSSDAILAEGIYDLVIGLNDFPYLDCKKDHHFGSRSIYDVVSRSPVACRPISLSAEHNPAGGYGLAVHSRGSEAYSRIVTSQARRHDQVGPPGWLLPLFEIARRFHWVRTRRCSGCERVAACAR